MSVNENMLNVFCCYLVTLYATNKNFVYFEKSKYKIKNSLQKTIFYKHSMLILKAVFKVLTAIHVFFQKRQSQ